MAAISIKTGEEFEPIEVNLWGAVFETRRQTRTQIKALKVAEQKLLDLYVETTTNDLGEEVRVPRDYDVDDEVALIGEVFDIRLKATDGKRKKPSALIQKRWEDDDLEPETLQALAAAIKEVEDAGPKA